MNSDISDDEQSRTSRYTRRSNRTTWVPPNGGRSSGASTGLPPSTTSFNSNTTPTMQNSNTHSVGLLDPQLSEERRRKLDAINKLNNLGAQRDIDLPQIVVVGSQSTGKSSLIESISGITLPRASGTCTRCPAECRLAHSVEPWQCTVSLKFTKDDQSGQPLDKVRIVQFGAPIRDRRQVEDRIRRAQQAILNPPTNPQSFLDGNQMPEGNNLAFSVNCVSLDISGPDVTDLSFIDLPGLISSVADGGRDGDVEAVQQLVSSYIEKPGCIILLTVACESDFETQGAYRLAKQFDKTGTRTIGILTKPDRIPEGEEIRWIRLIKNEVSPLQHGWYCVRQPSSKEMETGLTFQEARRRGEEFFRRAPWSMLDASYQKRLGTQAVTIKLNEFLMAVISKRIPEIVREIQKLLQETKEELSKLPKPSSQDPVMEVMHLIGNFSDDLHREADGFSRDAAEALEDDDESVIRLNHFRPIDKAQTRFRRSIRASAPNFRPFDFREDYQPKSRGDPEYEPDFLNSEEGEKICSLQEVVYRDDVVKRIQSATTRELPGYFPFQIAQKLISLTTDQWGAPALTLIHEIHEIVVEHQNKLIEKYFARHAEGGLIHTVSSIMHEYMQERRDKSLERVEWLLELEAHAFTVNKNYFNDYRGKFLSFYKDRQYTWGYPEIGPQGPWDPNQSALEIMATVRAYFHIAYKRVADNVPLAIDNELVRVNKRAVQEALSSGLKITDADGRERCRRLLAEPAGVVARREELESRLERLTAAQRELIGL